MTDTALPAELVTEAQAVLNRYSAPKPNQRDLEMLRLGYREGQATILRAFALATVDPSVTAAAGDAVRRAFGRALSTQITEGTRDA